MAGRKALVGASIVLRRNRLAVHTFISRRAVKCKGKERTSQVAAVYLRIENQQEVVRNLDLFRREGK